MLPQEIFLSHSSSDRDFADAVAKTLRNHGIPTWYSQTNILGAQQWQDEIGEALNRCDWFAIILSPNSVESMWVKRELMFALNANKFADKIVPILFQPCEFNTLSWTLSLFQMIKFSDDMGNGFRELLRTWGLGYRNL
ncbi:MAG: toll/interleukin-1 receptor domain-containing protein [Pyrinomonadaceae bacterium]|nr:toll/interleukin-1 receptor domain-containing protein [Pyrinomonadaceae bacterium]